MTWINVRSVKMWIYIVVCFNLQQFPDAAPMEQVYNTLADKLLAFNKINCLPSSVVTRFIGSQYFEEFLKSHKPTWHVSCRLQYNNPKLERYARPQALAAESSDSPIHKKWEYGTDDGEMVGCAGCRWRIGSTVGICTVFCGWERGWGGKAW